MKGISHKHLNFQRGLVISFIIILSLLAVTHFKSLQKIPLCKRLVSNSQVNQQVNTNVIDCLDIGDKLGSLLGGLSAFLAVGFSINEYRERSKQQQASEIRQVLRVIVKDSMEVFHKLEYGDCLTVASSNITKELQSRLSESPSTLEIKKYLGDKNFVKSVATVGWYSSPLTLQCEELLNKLKQNVINLNGDLCIIAEAIKLYIKIIKYKCSPEVFQQTLLKANDLSTDGKNISEFINELNSELQKCSLYQCVTKYNEVLEKINDFICILSYKLIDLDDDLLVKISKAKSVKESKMINGNEVELKSPSENTKALLTIKGHADSLKEHILTISNAHKHLDKNFDNGIDKLQTLATNIGNEIHEEIAREEEKTGVSCSGQRSHKN